MNGATYYQRVYSTGVRGWSYYSTQGAPNASPPQADTTPPWIGQIVSYQVLQVVGGATPTPGSTRVYNATPSGQIDGENVDFQLPTFVNGSQALFLNGVRLTPGEGNDYSTAESGGAGTGFDLVQLAYAPADRDRLLVDYEPVQ